MISPAPAESLAPIALLAFRRPLTTLQTLYTLSRCPEAAGSELYVFCDGARSEAERRDVNHTREVVRSHRWCGRVEVVEAEKNQGLARSVIGAVTRLTASHGRVIVLEDDLLVARGFLAYMNEALRRYAGDDRVMAVSGHTLDANPQEPRAVFLPFVTTWGWATWSRAWARFQERPEGLERLADRRFQHSFDLDGSIDYTGMLRAQIAGRMDSWGIRWWWSVHHHGGLSLFPLASLTRNVGADGAATHTHGDSPLLRSATFGLDNEIRAWPASVTVDAAAFEGWKTCLRGIAPPVRWRTRARRLARRAVTGVPEILARLARR
jgi:hypothetical protein